MLVAEKLLDHLEHSGVASCLIGGLALAAWGHARFTQDVDLLTLDDRILQPSFWQDSGLPEPTLRAGDATDPLGGVARIPLQPVHDLILGRGHAASHALDTAVAREGLPCRVASPLGLSLLKLEAGGPQDGFDILALLGLSSVLGFPDLTAEIQQQLPRLGPEARRFWEKLQSLR